MMFYAGIAIQSSPFAETPKYRIAKHPIRKRRRGWRVERYMVPAAWQMQDPWTGRDVIVMHPTLLAKLMEGPP